MNKTYFLFSDVHGHMDALTTSLNTAGFDPANENHILLGLGDYFDRGTASDKVIEFLLDYQSKNRFMGIYGNHDDMLKNFLQGLSSGLHDAAYNGLDKTLTQLSKLDANKFLLRYPHLIIDKIYENYPSIMKFLSSLVHKIDLGNYEIIHAGYSQNYGKWYIDNRANTEYFIEDFTPDPAKFYVFGHWHTWRLNRKFNNVDKEIEENTTFRYKNYIGLDACTNLSNFVNIIKLEELNGKITESPF